MKIVFATANQNKVKEVQALLPDTVQILSLKDINCLEDIPETSETIEGNAIQKAQYIFDNYGYACFADDTGLEVDALNGDPGIYSARYAEPEKNADNNMSKLLNELAAKNNRKAHFKTVIAIIGFNKELKTFEGICNGEITTEKYGEKGFGYDPIFKPFGYDITFAQMPLAEKNKIGHRGKAVQKLISYLTKTSYSKSDSK
ncbi:non-canonical purine NTP diphosphatase [Aquimarina agarivorans]|uniref:non-canonical purine NTP diphosphatase n=1 Tax=Aquimarina agarivorans TaxID=980584 RepID=UPI000248FAC3|nr:non-canonical purine NTP diphosphatase [Aquimarina agarivorans]